MRDRSSCQHALESRVPMLSHFLKQDRTRFTACVGKLAVLLRSVAFGAVCGSSEARSGKSKDLPMG
jgi:hypothetical protein